MGRFCFKKSVEAGGDTSALPPSNQDKPIDVETMVAAAKVSAQGLFRKDRGQAPARAPASMPGQP
jgi:hypothetical protein